MARDQTTYAPARSHTIIPMKASAIPMKTPPKKWGNDNPFLIGPLSQLGLSLRKLLQRMSAFHPLRTSVGTIRVLPNRGVPPC